MKTIRSNNIIVYTLISFMFSVTQMNGLIIPFDEYYKNEDEFKIQIQYSKHNSILIFLEKLASNSDNEFKSVYKSSIYNTTQNNDLIKQFSSLNWYFSKGRFKSTRQFKSICIKNDSWDEIINQAIGLLPDNTLYKLTDILKYFEPIYNTLVYQPFSTQFKLQLKSIEDMAKKKGLSQYFNNAKVFYGSNWNNKVPLIVTFYPIPHGEGFTAKTYGNTVTSGIPTDYTNINDLLSVIIHEACHLLYHNQTDKIKKMIENSFNSSKAITSVYAYHLFDEAIATTIGSGLTYKKLSGKLDERSWYYHKYINDMAKHVFPLVEDYIENGRTIDKTFIEAYIKKYNKRWLGEPKNLMTYHFILANHDEEINTLKSRFRYGNIYNSNTPITIKNLKLLKKSNLTKVVIINENNQEVFNKLKQEFSKLKLDLEPQKDFIFSCFLEDKTQFVIINGKKKSIEKLLNEFSLMKHIGIEPKVRYN